MTTSVYTFNLAGHVRHQGLPVSGVTVVLEENSVSQLAQSPLSTNRWFVPEITQKTGSRGEFSFAVPPGRYKLTFRPDPLTRYLVHTEHDVQVSSNTNCNISLRLGSMITVKLRTASGADPGSGEIVALGIEPSAYRSSTRSNRAGEYAMSLPRGRFHLSFSGGLRNWQNESVDRNVSGGVNTGSGGQTSSGRTAGSSGNIGSGGASGSIGSSASSGSLASGLRIDTGANADNGTINADREASRTFIVTAVKVLDVLSDGAETLTIPALVKLRGTVTGVFGEAVPGANITITPSAKSNNQLLNELSIKASLITDQQGKFELEAEPGLYDISISPDPASRLCELNEQAFSVRTDNDRTFQLAEGHRLRGQVYANDQPLQNSIVHVIGVDRKINTYTKTDEQGRFSIGVPAGNYKLVVLSTATERLRSITANAGRHNLAPWTRDIVVGGDTHVAVKLQNGVPLQGAIFDNAGSPRANVPIHVCSSTGSELQRVDLESAMASCVSDARGNFNFVLAPGAYWLCPFNDTANAERVDIETSPIKRDITWIDWCQVQFEVVGENGQKVPRCHISFAPYGTGEIEVSNTHDDSKFDLLALSGPGSGHVVTDEEGLGTILIPSGVYAIKIKPPPDGSWHSKAIRQLSVISDLTKTIKLPPVTST